MRKIKLQRIIIVAFAMAVIGALQSLYDHATLTSLFSSGQSDLYQFRNALLFNIISGFSGGLVAAFTLNFIDDKYRTKPYYQGLLIIMGVFTIVWVVRNVVEGAILMKSGVPFHFSFDGTDIKNIVFWMLIVLLAYFYLEMNNKFGPGKLLKIFLGKFNTPLEENRIFMFLDLKSSTSIAEKLGGIRYHLFLKALFSDVTIPILHTQGEIYQYVGDEIVLTWEMDRPENVEHCLQCFFEIQKFLEERASKYLQNFGVRPHFKAGAHCGCVIAGEIGVIKRDITYSGDVLNTTARIQGMCNELQSNFLISQSLFELHTSNKQLYKFEQKGDISLKGKATPMELMAVSRYP
ncbi:MAG: guanylate cyclase [Cytophagales bacterium CG12_big_fil_rev_8_21_14_0_65_40_12]|nr:MAG: guanylate cyclase [Cytophagales bacterium CG12_big_fil_rev_8_21_14_0_65_40_12]PIW03517.1 MAG: adenylate/guanylate cyclase domain-containing protein [Cytophagales bacterium CG17_big_fil_post_rev_8_21_14_2_50_40_13]